MLVIDTVSKHIEYRQVEGANEIVSFPSVLPKLKSEIINPRTQALDEIKKYIFYRLEVKGTTELKKWAKKAGIALDLRKRDTWLDLKGDLGTKLKLFIQKNAKRFADVKEIYKHRKRGGTLQEQIPEIPVVEKIEELSPGFIVELPIKTPHGMSEVGTVLEVNKLVLVRRFNGHTSLFHAANLKIIAKN